MEILPVFAECKCKFPLNDGKTFSENVYLTCFLRGKTKRERSERERRNFDVSHRKHT
jgi:hypothetical protein